MRNMEGKKKCSWRMKNYLGEVSWREDLGFSFLLCRDEGGEKDSSGMYNPGLQGPRALVIENLHGAVQCH